MDRRHNRYWRFAVPPPIPADGPGAGPGSAAASAPQRPDPCAGRLLVESGVDGSWRLLSRCEQLEALIAALDPRGLREMALAVELERAKEELTPCMPSRPLSLLPRGYAPATPGAAEHGRVEAEAEEGDQGRGQQQGAGEEGQGAWPAPGDAQAHAALIAAAVADARRAAESCGVLPGEACEATLQADRHLPPGWRPDWEQEGGGGAGGGGKGSAPPLSGSGAKPGAAGGVGGDAMDVDGAEGEGGGDGAEGEARKGALGPSLLSGSRFGAALAELKSRLARIEAALPDAAVAAEMLDRGQWLDNLRAAAGPADLRARLGELESALLPGYLAKEFVRMPQVSQH